MGASNFSPECESYVGQLLVLSPSYGWGWSRLDADAPSLDYAEVLQAGHFAVRVHEFFRFHGLLRSIVGVVEQAGHMFDRRWIVFYTMSGGVFDFQRRLCHRIDLQMGSQRPAGEWPEFTGVSPHINGYAHVAESAQLIDEFRAIR